MGNVVQLMMVLLCASVFSGCAMTDRAKREPVQITVMTYNIHHGEGTDGKLDLERIAKIIRTQNPDLVALQEVDDRAQRSGAVDQTAELGRLTGMENVFGKAMDFQGGGYGQAILSRWPIKLHEVHRLPQREKREPRIALATKIAAPFGEIVFASTHLDHQIEAVRVEQVAELNRVLKPKTSTSPNILSGDFNATPESAPMNSMLDVWFDVAHSAPASTIPSDNPRRRIDYVFCAPSDRWTTIHSKVLDEPVASDHRPVIATLKFAR